MSATQDKQGADSPQAIANWQAHYQAEYEFWNRLITDEVARRRFNNGYEPIECELYRSGKRWIGRTRICHRDFRVSATETFDSSGRAILKLSIRAIPG